MVPGMDQYAYASNTAAALPLLAAAAVSMVGSIYRGNGPNYFVPPRKGQITRKGQPTRRRTK